MRPNLTYPHPADGLTAGAHTLGRCHTDRSGFLGPWTNAPTTFSNLYFQVGAGPAEAYWAGAGACCADRAGCGTRSAIGVQHACPLSQHIHTGTSALPCSLPARCAFRSWWTTRQVLVLTPRLLPVVTCTCMGQGLHPLHGGASLFGKADHRLPAEPHMSCADCTLCHVSLRCSGPRSPGRARCSTRTSPRRS